MAATDRDVPIAAAREMASRIPGSTLYCFEGKGHLPTFTATAEFCDVLRRFVRGEALGAPHSSLNAVRKVSLTGCRRYSIMVRSPVTIMVSAGMPG